MNPVKYVYDIPVDRIPALKQRLKEFATIKVKGIPGYASPKEVHVIPNPGSNIYESLENHKQVAIAMKDERKF